jgi:type I restriction enzyme M protein
MPDHMTKILDALEKRNVEDYFSLVVENTDLAANAYNLSVSSYITAEDTREVIEIEKLNAEIEDIVSKQSVLRQRISSIVADLEDSK